MPNNYIKGITVTPSGNRTTTIQDWENANNQDAKEYYQMLRNKENIKTKIQQNKIANNIRNTTGQFAERYVSPILSTLHPGLVIPGVMGYIGGTSTDKIVQSSSKGKYNTWGQMLSDKTGVDSKTGQMLLELTNPGALLLAFGGNKVTRHGPYNYNYKPIKPFTYKDLVKRYIHALPTEESISKLEEVLSNPEKNLSNFENVTLRRSFNPEVFKANLKNWKSELDKHGLLTKIGEYEKMGTPESQVVIDESIKDFYRSDVWPRFRRNFSEMLDPVEMEDLKDIVQTPWENVDLKYGYTPPGVGGYSQGPNFVRLSKPTDNSVLAHELHHSFRDRVARKTNIGRQYYPEQYSTEQIRESYQRAYNPYTAEELTEMRPFKFDEDFKGRVIPPYEVGATSEQLRFDIFNNLKNKLGRTPTVDEVNTEISNMDNNKLLETVKNKNDYGKNFVEQNPDPEGFKKGLIKIAGISLPIIYGKSLNSK